MVTLTELAQTVCQRLAGSCYCKANGLQAVCSWGVSVKEYACTVWTGAPPPRLTETLATTAIEVMVETAREE